MKILKRIVWFLLGTIATLSLITYLFYATTSFGKLPKGERQSRIDNSPNFKDGKFKNLEETKMIADDASYFGMFTKFFGSDSLREPSSPLPTVKTDLKSLSPQKPTLIWFGHSSYLISIGNKKILADPIFSERASPVQYAGSKKYPGTEIYNTEDFPDLDVILISHDHYDHLDYNTILKLNDKTKLFCVPLGIGEHLEYWVSKKVRFANTIGGKVKTCYREFTSLQHQHVISRVAALVATKHCGLHLL